MNWSQDSFTRVQMHQWHLHSVSRDWFLTVLSTTISFKIIFTVSPLLPNVVKNHAKKKKKKTLPLYSTMPILSFFLVMQIPWSLRSWLCTVYSIPLDTERMWILLNFLQTQDMTVFKYVTKPCSIFSIYFILVIYHFYFVYLFYFYSDFFFFFGGGSSVPNWGGCGCHLYDAVY